MKRRPLSATGVAVLVLLAGTMASTGATMANSQQQALDATPDALNQQYAENATTQVNVTLETVKLQNVTITDVTVDHVHITGNVTAGDRVVLETGNDAETVENITAQRLEVTNATLENVSFSNLTLRNESLATALLGTQPANGDELTVSNATLENRTIDGLVIEHGTLGDATIDDLQVQNADAMGTEAEGMRQGNAAMDIFSASVEDAAFGNISAVEFSAGNETTAPETTDGNDDA